jgi:uncharacterized phage protein (TIGR02220 family)
MNLIERAVLLIGYLNERSGSRYRARSPDGKVSAMAEFVIARLKQGYSDEESKSVIDVKCKQWLGDDRMAKYLTPETLFRRSNFERYLAECEEPAAPALERSTTSAGQSVETPVVADPERVREALAKGWEILRGGRKVG